MADGLATLHRLRKLEADQAARALAAGINAARHAALQQQSAADALQNEARLHPADISHALARAYAAWRPKGLAAWRDAAAASRKAAADSDALRDSVAASRAAVRAVDAIMEERKTERSAALQRTAQQRLDDFRRF